MTNSLQKLQSTYYTNAIFYLFVCFLKKTQGMNHKMFERLRLRLIALSTDVIHLILGFLTLLVRRAENEK